ncbi:MAG TPA: hypothetical protein VHK90_13745 [Thermoanaerobaculia bacterium]|nr:hypothetical protein [Thermoanaerobaculia bacterium]
MSRTEVELPRTAAERREQEIAELIETVARPKAIQLIQRYGQYQALRPEDAEDIVATVALRLVARLRAGSQDDPILQFDDYVARLTFNAINDHFRRRFPQRARLKNRVRYALTHDPRLALWHAAGVLVCGLSAWKGNDPAPVPSHLPFGALQRHRDRPALALVQLFESGGRPLALETLVDVLAELWHVVEAPPAPAVVTERPAETAFEWREFLTALWREAVQLRPMQRRALLLNLRDAETTHVLSLLVFTGIATMDEIAAAVDMTRSELDSIWNELPLDDLRIAGMLNITRQQVINLRKSARERLARRLSYKRTGS